MNPLHQPAAPILLDVLRNDALTIFQAGINAADSYKAVRRCLAVTDGRLEILLNPADSRHNRSGNWSKIHVLAFGKAACAMAKAACEYIPEPLLATPCIAVTNYENAVPVDRVEVIGAGHPLPDETGLIAARKIAERAESAQPNELVLVLISGGGSALIPYPANGISLADKISVTDRLLASGATINEINCVRKHLSQLKGGGLARMAAPTDLHALILSDVLGDDLSVIASGPTVPDETSYADAIAICRSKAVWNTLPPSVRHHLEQGQGGNIPETPKPGDAVFDRASSTLVGGNAISIQAMQQTCAALGYQVRLYDDKLRGEARLAAEQLALAAKQALEHGVAAPLALVAGGETTVTVQGNGQGGRNQELALAFAIAAERCGLTGQWAFLSGGTDGRDGPTDAAGGLVDPNTVKRLKDSAIMPIAMLDNNDSYNALKISQDLLITGATGTNVADLQVLLIHPRY